MLLPWRFLGNIYGVKLTRKLVSSVGTQGQCNSLIIRRKDEQRMELSISRMVKHYNSTSTSIMGKEAPGFLPLNLNEMKTSL